MTFLKRFREDFFQVETFLKIDKTVREQVKRNDSIIIGGQAIKKQLGFHARNTFDFDVLASNPRKSSRELERTLDKDVGANLFFARPSFFHPVTHKVIHKGSDRIPNTKDDIGIADFSPMRDIPTVKIDGIRFSTLTSTVKDKKKALSDPQSEFRHAKDQDDINRITFHKKLKKVF